MTETNQQKKPKGLPKRARKHPKYAGLGYRQHHKQQRPEGVIVNRGMAWPVLLAPERGS